MRYKAQYVVITLFNSYSTLACEAKYKVIHGHVCPSELAWLLIILTAKQMLQRLQTALVQIKAGYTPEKLLNEIHQIIYSLYHAKEITKKDKTI